MDKNFEDKMKRMVNSAIPPEAKDEPKMESAKVDDPKEPAEKQEKEEEMTSTSKPDAVQKRINKLVAEKKSAKEELEKTRSEFEEFKKKGPSKSDEEPMKGEPQLKDFNHVNEWAAAMKKFHTQEVSKHVETKMRAEHKNEEIKTKFSKLIDEGKKHTETHGLEPEEYEDRIKSVEGKLKIHRAVQNELLNSEHGHMIALDIANDPESFNKMAEEDTENTGAKQMKWLAKREAHYENAGKGEHVEEDKPVRKTTKAAAPDSKLATGMGSADDGGLSKDGKLNWQAIRKAVKRKV